MKAAPRRIWRPLRSFLILTCVAGAVLAADNTWLTDLRFEFDAADWWSNISPAAMPSADIAIANPPANRTAPDLSMSRLLNGLLFSKPSSGWRLEPQNTELASAWMTQQSGGYFATASSRFNYSQPESSVSGFVTRAAFTAPAAVTATGTWISNGSGNWSDPARWSGSFVPDGTGDVADFSKTDITTDVTVNLDGSRTVGFLEIGDTNATNKYTISTQIGATLIFDTGAMTHADLSQVSTSAGDTLSMPIVFRGNFNINNFSNLHEFTITGNISSSATNDFQTIAFNPSVSANAGQIRVNGIIGNGLTGSVVSVEVDKGTVIFAGNNSYTGSTFVGGGTLLVNGNQSAADGLVQVSGAGSVLGGTGTIGGSVYTFGGTITGATTTSVGTLTLQGSVIMHTGETSGGTYLANLSGATSDLLAISKVLTLGTDTTLDIVGAADGMTTYVLATFGGLSSEPGQNRFGTVLGLPTGYDLVYNATDIELVPTAIPEPATWIGGALALGAIGFAWRSRKAEKLKR
jgi:fibronectin-binding autotransporter adhesin